MQFCLLNCQLIHMLRFNDLDNFDHFGGTIIGILACHLILSLCCNPYQFFTSHNLVSDHSEFTGLVAAARILIISEVSN